MRFSQEFSIGRRRVGAGHPPFVIADVGSNHGQDIRKAKRLIDAAADAGADAVKFQSLDLGKLYAGKVPEPTRKLFGQIRLEESWHAELKEHSDSRGILFSSSPTYLGAVELLERTGVEFYKIASAQAVFPQLVEAVAQKKKPVIFSTGISEGADIGRMLEIFSEFKNPDIVLLHCIARYPTKPADANLRMLEAYRREFGCLTGFSDHSLGTHLAVAATALGAVAIEKHLAFSRSQGTPDAFFSLEPDEFKQLVSQVKDAHEALGEGLSKKLGREEEDFKKAVLYRLVARRDLPAGHLFSAGDFDFQRAPGGIDARQMGSVVKGGAAAAAIRKGEVITENMVSTRRKGS